MSRKSSAVNRQVGDSPDSELSFADFLLELNVSQHHERVRALLGRGFARALEGGRELFPDLCRDRDNRQSVIGTLWKAAQLPQRRN